jgi:hypothetical protein
MAALAPGLQQPDLKQVEQHIVEMTNQARSGQNLAALKLDALLANAARAFARSLARSGEFSHSAGGSSPTERAARAGYKSCTVAENLAMDRSSSGLSTGTLAIQVVAGWMNSAAHRANIMSAAVTEVGVGVAEAPGAVAKFISVELFGRPQSASVAFQVVNASDTEVRFAFAGKVRDLKPRVSVVETSCQPGEIAFSTAGGLFSTATEIARMPAKSGMLYTLKSEVKGTLKVEMTPRRMPK